MESSSDSEIGVYDESSDTYYDPQGWYELVDNWGEFSHILVTAGVVKFWMRSAPLPQALVDSHKAPTDRVVNLGPKVLLARAKRPKKAHAGS
jgi:hypothetical protein